MQINHPDALQQPTADDDEIEELFDRIMDPDYDYVKDEWMKLVVSSIFREAKTAISAGDITPAEAASQLRRYASAGEEVKEYHRRVAHVSELGDLIGEDGLQVMNDVMDDMAGDDPLNQFGNAILKGCSMGLREPRVDFVDIRDHLLFLSVAVGNADN